MNYKNEFYNYTSDIISKNIKKLIALSFLYILLQVIIGGIILTGYSNYINKQINNNIIEYNEIDLSQLCSISECKQVISPIFTLEIQGKKLIKSNYILNKLMTISPNIIISKELDFVLFNDATNSYFVLNISDIKKMLITTSLFVTPILILLTLVSLLISIHEEREITIRALAGNEALLANKSMILITENIHHELNTPMEVIDNKVYKLKNIMKAYIDSIPEEKKRAMDFDFYNTDKDFELLGQASEQIYAVLERMKGFKNLRYSNGNKSISDIMQGAFKVISISNSNFTSNIDAKLEEYSINSTMLKNADLLNIVINHIKNSLEANAKKIYILFESVVFNKDNGILKFRIADNGNGVKPEHIKGIFDPNTSTKSIGSENGVRGNGLYLNKFILKSSGGSVTLVETSKYGTTFEISIPVKLRNQEINKS